MKKIYTKPEILFEDFSLNAAITAGCTALVNGPSQGSCPLTVKLGPKETNIFVTTMEVCTTKYGEGEYNGLCYHTFADNAAGILFNS